MKRTTLLIAALAITAVATTTPAFAMRDPGPGPMAESGMSLYQYGHAHQPPHVGQAGLDNQYADGMNLYQYVGTNPSNFVDPYGLLRTPGRARARMFRRSWSRSRYRTLKMPSFTLSPGLSGSVAFYAPVLSGVGGVYIKVTGTEKRGKCCQDGRTRFYVQHSVSGEGGVYAATKHGFKPRLTAPIVEEKKKCPKPEKWQCKGFFKVGVRLSLASASCTWTYGSGWDCGAGIRLKWKDAITARATVGGGVKCAQTKVGDNPIP